MTEEVKISVKIDLINMNIATKKLGLCYYMKLATEDKGRMVILYM